MLQISFAQKTNEWNPDSVNGGSRGPCLLRLMSEWFVYLDEWAKKCKQRKHSTIILFNWFFQKIWTKINPRIFNHLQLLLWKTWTHEDSMNTSKISIIFLQFRFLLFEFRMPFSGWKIADRSFHAYSNYELNNDLSLKFVNQSFLLLL